MTPYIISLPYYYKIMSSSRHVRQDETWGLADTLNKKHGWLAQSTIWGFGTHYVASEDEEMGRGSKSGCGGYKARNRRRRGKRAKEANEHRGLVVERVY